MHSGKAGTLLPSPTQMALAMPAWASQPASRVVPGMGTEPARGRLAQPLRVLHPAWCVVTMERHQQAPQCLGNTGWKGSSLLWGPGLGMLGCGLGEGPGEFWGSARHLGGGRSQNQRCPAECGRPSALPPSALPKSSCYPSVQTGKLRLREATTRDQSETTKER